MSDRPTERECEEVGEHRGEALIMIENGVQFWECTTCGAEWYEQDATGSRPMSDRTVSDADRR